MIRAQGAFAPLPGNDLQWDADGHPRSQRYDDGFFGSGDALAESRHVFLDGSDLPARFRTSGRECFVVAELGFGTGLNFLLTRAAHRADAPPEQRLHYISIDSHPLRREELARATAAQGGFGDAAAELSAVLPPPVEGVHRRLLDGGRVILDLYWADARDALEELLHGALPAVDAWYFDGFAPSRNPAMWSDDVLRYAATVSRAGATVASYSAAGAVRRALENAGFSIQKRPGFGRKRESIGGTLRERPPAPPPRMTPWDRGEPRNTDEYDRRALVIGGGLAGAHAAAALARRGWEVTVCDAGEIAGGASGNPQGLLFNRLSHQRSALSDFSLAALLFAHDLYAACFRNGDLVHGEDGALDGCYQTAPPRGDFAAVCAAVASLPELAETRGSAAAAGRLGVTPREDGLWHHHSGWLSPPRVCAALLRQPGIRVAEGCGPLTLQRRENAWEAMGDDGRRRARAPVAIIAAGVHSGEFTGLGDLPLRVARGQTTQIPEPPGTTLRHAVCHHGYIAPAVDGYHCIGASFRPGDGGRDLRMEEHRSNLDALANALPEWAPYLASLDPARLGGRAELRCVSPDYLPLAGPVPDREGFLERFADLSRDARQVLDRPGAYQPGLYVSTAMGSRGLSYAALAAELVASRICDEPPPLSAELLRAVAPARFLIRAMVRGEEILGESR